MVSLLGVPENRQLLGAGSQVPKADDLGVFSCIIRAREYVQTKSFREH